MTISIHAHAFYWFWTLCPYVVFGFYATGCVTWGDERIQKTKTKTKTGGGCNNLICTSTLYLFIHISYHSLTPKFKVIFRQKQISVTSGQHEYNTEKKPISGVFLDNWTPKNFFLFDIYFRHTNRVKRTVEKKCFSWKRSRFWVSTVYMGFRPTSLLIFFQSIPRVPTDSRYVGYFPFAHYVKPLALPVL